MEMAMREDFIPTPPPTEGGHESLKTLKEQVRQDLKDVGMEDKLISYLMENPAHLGILPGAFNKLRNNPDAIERLQKLAMENIGNLIK